MLKLCSMPPPSTLCALCLLAMALLGCGRRKAESSRTQPSAAVPALAPNTLRVHAERAHQAGAVEASARAPTAAALPCDWDAVCQVQGTTAERACREGERARLMAAGQAPGELDCRLVGTTAPGARLRAALLELQDDDQDIPLVLVFGVADFTHVARLLSIDDSVGASGGVAIERFEIMDALPGDTPEVVLELRQHRSWANDAPPGPVHNETLRWLFLCSGEPDPECVRVLLGANARSQPGAALVHGRFELTLALQPGRYRLERRSGVVPKPYRALLGEHTLSYLVETLLLPAP